MSRCNPLQTSRNLILLLVQQILLANLLEISNSLLVAVLNIVRSFPGLGLHWVDVDGPYNEHLTRDAGSFMLALLVLTVAAALSRRQSLLRITGVASSAT